MDDNNLVKQMIEGIQFLIEANDKSTKIYNGVVKAVNSDEKYTITFNGKTYNLPLYGSNTISVNQIVKVFIPQNNINLAFIM